ncbi:hypothetical protein ACNFU2_16950 [Chryseobacterium sp. PTM-20240506]|uniref:hypothetical protein n=1 Tax=Chryseobacterium sp. PTM-20240506 TaxID=3400631 RepID=UPI003AAB042E
MDNKEIVNIGKYVFWLSFLLGNICLFGYLVSRIDVFAIGGFLLLIFGSILNLLVIAGLLIYGSIYHTKLHACLQSIGILLINIPIACLYTVIGVNLN